MKDIAKVDQKVQSEGRFISVVLAPDKAKKIKKEEGSSKDDNIIETKTEETQK
jgi:hypothetical protein